MGDPHDLTDPSGALSPRQPGAFSIFKLLLSTNRPGLSAGSLLLPVRLPFYMKLVVDFKLCLKYSPMAC
jgi:hypothetical protein